MPADTVAAGDVVRVQAGTYAERVSPGVDGTAVDATVTFVADGPVNVCGFDITNGNYIKVIGFVIDTDDGTCVENNGAINVAGTNTFLEFWNNIIRDANYNGIRMGVNDTMGNSIIIGNTFYNFGIGNGSGMAVSIRGNNNIISHNELYNCHPDGFLMIGTYNRFLNNYAHDFSEISGGHSDYFQTGTSTNGWSYNLIEGNFQMGMGNTGNEHVAQISHSQKSTYCPDPATCGAMTENIFRRNVWHNVSSGTIGINQVTDGSITYTRYYNNTTAKAESNYPDSIVGLAWYGTLIDNAYLLNNIEYEIWGTNKTTGLGVYCLGTDTGCGLDYTYTVNYNLGYDPDGSVTFAAPFSTQANGQLNKDPAFVDYAGHDFTIGATSNAKATGGPLAVTSGAGTGTTFNVVAGGGGFFRGPDANLTQYGGALTVGDVITVGTDVVTVTSITADAITVTPSFTWEDAEPVYYGSSATPDIGAYPYKAGGYSLTATYSKAGSTVTVNPSDANLVRFVICYEDGIPTTVDNASPYTCTVGGGVVTVKVYPLYASSTPIITATYGGTATLGGSGTITLGGSGTITVTQ